jgi:predicted phosphoribosyltransferase
MSFVNRSDAGRRLAQALMRYRAETPVVLALPRGGVPVAAEVAAALDAPLDLLFVRKIGVPMQPELAMGAVSDGDAPLIVRNEDVIALTGVSEDEFAAVACRELAEIDRRRGAYAGDRPTIDVAGRTVIVVDDGVATGATTRAGLQAVRARRPKTLVLAVPVAPTQVLAELKSDSDDVVCLEAHEIFSAIGAFYDDFRQVSDREVRDALARAQAMRATTPKSSAD